MNLQEIFIDTGFWLSYLVRRDKHYCTSALLMDKLMEQGTLLVTSDLVVAETYTLLMRKVGTAGGLKFLDLLLLQVKERFTKVHYMDGELVDQAHILLKKYADWRLSFTDAASVAIIMRRGTPAIATFDRHFRAMGCCCLPHLD